MYTFVQKLDQFTDFAKDKVTVHAKEVGEQHLKSKIASDVMQKTFHHHEQVLKDELENKIDELSIQDSTLLKPSLGILKDYFLEVFKTRAQR